MKRLLLIHTTTINFPKLYDALIAAIPQFAPVSEGIDPTLGEEIFRPAFRLERLPNQPRRAMIFFPDAVTDATVQAVLAAHDPAPVPPHPDERLPIALRARLTQVPATDDILPDALLAKLTDAGGNLTQAEIKALFRLIFRILRYIIRRLPS